MMTNSQRTIYSMKLLNNMLIGKHYKTLPNTTLNEKFDIYPESKIPYGKYPKLKYFTIGIGGKIKLDNTEIYTISEHQPIDAALFEHIPFILRKTDDDLEIGERSNYRLRKTLIINGIEYYAYYAKKCIGIDSRDYYNSITSKDNISILSMYDMNNDKLLNPTPSTRKIDLNTINKLDYIMYRFVMPFKLNYSELKEIINVYSILNINPKSTITEIGVCFGHEVECPYGYEIIDTQIGFHVGINLDTKLSFDNKEDFLFNIELGGAEPLIIG